jgi:hypothetical protein
LADILKSNKVELNECVENGGAPFFGYPPVLYSPPENQTEKMAVFLGYIFNKGRDGKSFSELL